MTLVCVKLTKTGHYTKEFRLFEADGVFYSNAKLLGFARALSSDLFSYSCQVLNTPAFLFKDT